MHTEQKQIKSLSSVTVGLELEADNLVWETKASAVCK